MPTPPAAPKQPPTQPAAPLTVSVVMPAFNAAQHLTLSLPPLLTLLQRGLVLELLVVDDGSTDGTAALAAGMGATVLPSGGRTGPAAARNVAARQARGDLLWFVDADVVVHGGTAERLLRRFEDPALAAVFGSYCDAPPEQSFFSQYKNLLHHFHHQRNAGASSSFWSGCGAVRRIEFLAVGGFDARQFPRPSIEDVELGHRMQRAGLRIDLDPALFCTHLKHWSLAQLVMVDIRARALPWCRLILAGRAPARELNVAPAERRSALLALGLLGALGLAWQPWLPAWLPGLLCLLALWSNWQLLRFFQAKRGSAFALAAWSYHQIFYLYSSMTMACCWTERRLGLAVGHPAPSPQDATPAPTHDA